jgi:uncharacterized repeat protein (TIGR03803 family)
MHGNLYGTTTIGGPHDPLYCQSGCGTIFKITLDGTLTTLRGFVHTDGNLPCVRLVQGVDGNFYGTTEAGGSSDFGTVFKITPAGVLTTLHSVAGTDGLAPVAGLVQGTDGNFYGSASLGGTEDCYRGCGTIFQITPGGTLTVLHSFVVNDGADPRAALV